MLRSTEQKKSLLMWGLYSLLLLAIVLVQTVLLGKIALFGVHFDLLPLLVCAVAVFHGAEAGGMFALAAGLLWALSGGGDGSILLVCLTVCGVLCGYLCDAVLHRRTTTFLILCLLSLLFCGFGTLLVRVFTDGVGLWGIFKVLIRTAISLPLAPGFYYLARAIGKAGP